MPAQSLFRFHVSLGGSNLASAAELDPASTSRGASFKVIVLGKVVVFRV